MECQHNHGLFKDTAILYVSYYVVTSALHSPVLHNFFLVLYDCLSIISLSLSKHSFIPRPERMSFQLLLKRSMQNVMIVFTQCIENILLCFSFLPWTNLDSSTIGPGIIFQFKSYLAICSRITRGLFGDKWCKETSTVLNKDDNCK